MVADVNWRNMNWYVLRIDNEREKTRETGITQKSKRTAEEKVLNLLENRLSKDVYKPFIPMKVYPRTKKGKLISRELKICFPGYVFIATEKDDDFVIKDTKLILDGIKEAHFFLAYENNVIDGKHLRREYAMRRDERLTIEALMDDDFIIGSSVGFIEGDRVKITSGSFMGQDGLVKKIDRRKMTATIEVAMFGGNKIDLTIMLEIIEKSLV